VIVVFVRHARAGDREKWEGDDRLRPLDRKGRRQAEGLVEMLPEFPIERLLSSPYLRCVQSFEPLAQALGLEIEDVAELAEGTSRREVLRLLGSLQNACVALNTHGGVDMEVIGGHLKKGAAEVLEFEDGRIKRVRYLGRPPV
jgi:phosphohistidine phosphatase SixA